MFSRQFSLKFSFPFGLMLFFFWFDEKSILSFPPPQLFYFFGEGRGKEIGEIPNNRKREAVPCLVHVV